MYNQCSKLATRLQKTVDGVVVGIQRLFFSNLNKKAFVLVRKVVPSNTMRARKNHHWLILKAFDNFLKCCCFSVGESPQSRVKCRWEDRGKLCWEIFIWSEGSLCLPPLPSPHSAPPNPPPPPPPAPPPAAHLKEELVLRSPRLPSLLHPPPLSTAPPLWAMRWLWHFTDKSRKMKKFRIDCNRCKHYTAKEKQSEDTRKCHSFVR